METQLADSRIIALLTDFGTRDPFVGTMKGVILGINPSAPLVDLGHNLEPGDVRSASFALRMAFPYFPQGTIFLAVIDPGVGTERTAIALEVGGRIIVCPNNGLPSWVLQDRKPGLVVELTEPRFHLPDVSTIFHGRDVFAPVAAHLSKGAALSDLGPAVDNLETFDLPQVSVRTESLEGEVVYIDRFGNLITNIDRESLEKWLAGVDGGRISVQLGSRDINGISQAYGDVPPGYTVALISSSGFLEIGLNQGNAAAHLGIDAGFPVMVYNIPATRKY
jgi:hypothetical protein